MGPWLLCSIALVAGASANPAVQITSPTVTDPPLVIATGDAILLQAPDLAFVMIGIEGQGGRPRNAEDEAAKTMTTLQASIKALGFSGDAIKTVSFSLQPRYQYGGGRQYLARHVIEVMGGAPVRTYRLYQKDIG